MKIMSMWFVIITFALVQCSNTINKSEQFSHEKIIQNAVDTSYIMKHFNKMGVDDSEFLNNYEIKYFNEEFKYFRENFDFEGKKICFFGPGGLVFSDKQKYFKSLQNNNFNIQNDLYVFNEHEKKEAGGYDAAIVYWSKRMYLPQDLIKRLKEKQ